MIRPGPQSNVPLEYNRLIRPQPFAKRFLCGKAIINGREIELQRLQLHRSFQLNRDGVQLHEWPLCIDGELQQRVVFITNQHRPHHLPCDCPKFRAARQWGKQHQGKNQYVFHLSSAFNSSPVN